MSALTSTTFVELATVTMTDNQTIIPTTITIDMESTVPVWIRIVLLIFMILIDVVAFLGNLLVICAFYRTRRLQTVTNYFIASLAFADALVAIFVLPLSILHYHRDRSWKLGLILCDLWVSSDVLLCTSSILNLTCISVDRYMAITRPLTYTAYRSKFLARIMILLVWIVSAVITCPPIFGWRDPNRRFTVEEEHRCDLNTARGYVVYSALGSFYIPAVIMIFVYIRIFMVVYDRDNLINKFHDNDNHPQKAHPNGLPHSKPTSDRTHFNSVKSPKKSSCCCCCLCFRKKSPPTSSYLQPQILAQSGANSIASNFDRKGNSSFIYRFPSKTHYSSASSSMPNTPPSFAKKPTTIFCRPCTISAKRMPNLSDEIYHYRRNYLSGIGAEYQFRSGDSPCYELKTFQDSLPTLTKCRSNSFEQLSSDTKRDPTTKSSHNQHLKTGQQQANVLNGNLLVSQDKQIAKSLNELTEDISHLSMIDQTKIYEMKYSMSPLKPSSLCSQTNSTDDSKSLPEQTRINRRMKPSRATKLTPSEMLIENLKQQHKFSSNPRSSSTSTRRLNEIGQQKSNVPCYCCFQPMENWCERKTKSHKQYTPNQSLTNDEDEKEELSSNEMHTRTPMLRSHPSLRATNSSNQNIVVASTSSIHHPIHPTHDVHRRERIRFMKEQKTAKTLAVVVGGFILFWLPFFIMYIIPPDTYSFNNLTVTLITWLGYFNSVINPFIYAYCSKQFRMAFWNITLGLCFKKSNTSTPKGMKK
ncbi:unnamed protein product [Adineta ricciae]|uniref:G-protein coupled receptors family 1 profile domain-containing protein n=1 Tax=Adineta ricciae TaxID=249248 RepID=A0A816EIM8_ADIRI|nr:unnamed protein product [Adineta ricciae]